MNINPDTQDINYRYKMPQIMVRQAGRGNGSYTFLDNINEVAISINTPPAVLLNFITRSLGSSYNLGKKTITGHYDFNTIIKEIYNFIKFFVLCKKCSIPETIPFTTGKKKKLKLHFKCSACGGTSEIITNSKLYDKTIETIIKNIDLYVIKEGNLVQQNNKDLFNPF